VATPNDFGARGRRPTHPELLDFLAAEFVASGWSVKALHRASCCRRLTGCPAISRRPTPLDPENQWLWRYPRRRLEAEAIRDAMLALGGNLDRSPGGPHPFPPVDTWAFTQHNPSPPSTTPTAAAST